MCGRWALVRLALVALALAVALAGCALHHNLRPPGDMPPKGSALTLMSFNIRHGCGVESWGDTSSQFFQGCKKHLQELAAAIRSKDPDLVALQEVNDGQAADLAAALRLNYAYSSHNAGGYGGWWGNAVLSRYPLVESRLVPIGARPGFNRSAVLAVADVHGQRVAVLSIHTDHRYGGEDSLRALLRAAAAAPGPVVLMGDFNMGPVDRRHELLRQAGFVETFRAAGQDAPTTFPGLGQIDYIYVRPEQFRVLEAALVPEAHWKASDHRALYARVEPVR